MAFWIMMFAFTLIIPADMVLFGRRFEKKPPEKINYLYGYRTKMACLNENTWRFAHRKLGEVWQKAGIIMLAVTVAYNLFLIGKSEDTVSIAGCVLEVMQVIAMIFTVLPVESALRRTFDKNGNKISDEV